MRIFYDTEFLEDGRTIELISIGMVAEDGRELYAVNDAVAADPLHKRICQHQWLMENVVPHLPISRRYNGEKAFGQLSSASTYHGFFNIDMASNVVMPRRMIRNAVQAFIQDTPNVELWAWYGAYDHVVLSQLWGRMVDHPDGVPMWTNDLKQEVVRLGNPQLPKQESAEHNALADARWARDSYRYLLEARNA